MNYPISVVMSIFNGEQYLAEAIESILSQTFKDFEFIIIDDGSTDKSVQIINSYKDNRIKLIRQENKGLASALNIGIKISQGKYIARMDADDISFPNRLELQYNFLENNCICAAAGTSAEIIDKDGNYLYTSQVCTDWETIKKRLPDSPFYHSSVLFKKDIAERCGLYNENLYISQDKVLFAVMAKYGELRNLSDILIKYRISPYALTTNYKKITIKRNEIINRALQNGNITDADAFELKALRKNQSSRFRMGNYYFRIGSIYLNENFHRGKAARNFLLSNYYYPLNLRAWFYLILSIIPRFVIRHWYHRKNNF